MYKKILILPAEKFQTWKCVRQILEKIGKNFNAIFISIIERQNPQKDKIIKKLNVFIFHFPVKTKRVYYPKLRSAYLLTKEAQKIYKETNTKYLMCLTKWWLNSIDKKAITQLFSKTKWPFQLGGFITKNEHKKLWYALTYNPKTKQVIKKTIQPFNAWIVPDIFAYTNITSCLLTGRFGAKGDECQPDLVKTLFEKTAFLLIKII